MTLKEFNHPWLTKAPTLTPLKRKFRWTFEGKDVEGQTLFEESFVKVSHRPHLGQIAVADENGGHIEHLPGEIDVTQCYIMFDSDIEKLEATAKFEQHKAVAENIKTAILRIYCGAGTLLETWTLREAVMTLSLLKSMFYDDGEMEPVWSVSYQKCDWEQLYDKLLGVSQESRPSDQPKLGRTQLTLW